MVHCQTIERQFLRRQRHSEVWIALLIASQDRGFELRCIGAVRWPPHDLDVQTAIILFAVALIKAVCGEVVDIEGPSR